MSSKEERRVRLTLESLGAHNAIEKSRSTMEDFTSNNDSHARFRTSGNVDRRAFDVERGLKEHQRGMFGGNNGKVGKSSKKSQKKGVKPKDLEQKGFKQKDEKQKEGQNDRERDRWGRDGDWYRG